MRWCEAAAIARVGQICSRSGWCAVHVSNKWAVFASSAFDAELPTRRSKRALPIFCLGREKDARTVRSTEKWCRREHAHLHTTIRPSPRCHPRWFCCLRHRCTPISITQSCSTGAKRKASTSPLMVGTVPVSPPFSFCIHHRVSRKLLSDVRKLLSNAVRTFKCARTIA